MSCYRYVRSARNRGVDINMAPLIDMIFILLIFFIVTASFVRDAGVDVQRPGADTGETRNAPTLQVGLTPEGGIFIDGKRVDIRSVRPRVAEFLAATPEGGVLVVADADSRTESVVRIIDQCRLAGAANVGIATHAPR